MGAVSRGILATSYSRKRISRHVAGLLRRDLAIGPDLHSPLGSSAATTARPVFDDEGLGSGGRHPQAKALNLRVIENARPICHGQAIHDPF